MLKSLKSICELLSDGDHGSAEYADEGVPFVLSEAVKAGWIDRAACRAITPEHAATLPRSTLQPDDVLVTKTGVYFGRSAVVPSELAGANTIAHVGLLRIKKSYDPYFVSTFLNCAYGYSQLRRRGIKATRPEIKLIEFADISIPTVSSRLASAVRRSVLMATKVRNQAMAVDQAAESLISSILGVAAWKMPLPLTYEQSNKNVLSASRLDAEFHRPKYEALGIEVAARFVLQVLAGSVLKGSTVPYYEDGAVPIIRSGDLGSLDGESSFLRTDPDEDIFDLEVGDVLISSIGFGSIGKVQVFDLPGRYGTVSEVTVVRQRRFNPYYLTAFLRSVAGQMQIERFITGATGQLHLYGRDVSKFWVPVLPEKTQLEFEQMAIAARQGRQASRVLLDAAKRAVEIAVEDSEAAALAWLSAATVAP